MHPQIQHAHDAATRGDLRATLEALLAVWRDRRAPLLGDAIEAIARIAGPAASPDEDFAAVLERRDVLDVGALADRMREVNAAGATGRAQALAALPADPRIATAAVGFFAAPPWHATGSSPFYTRVAALLEKSADPRAIARLAAVPEKLGVVKGAAMRGKLEARVRALEEEMKKTFATMPSLDADENARIGEIVSKAESAPRHVSPPVTTRSAPRAEISETDLFAAVAESPDDDGPRALLQDYLLERQDPRGEFLALQFARERGSSSPKDQKREAALLRKHQAGWLGEMTPHVEYKGYQLLGAETDWGTHIRVRWRRGFIAGAMLKFTLPAFQAKAKSPMWATLEQVSVGTGHDGAWEKAFDTFLASLRGLRRFDSASPKRLPAILGSAVGDRLEHLHVIMAQGEWERVREHLQGRAPRLVRLHLRITGDAEEVRTVIVDAMESAPKVTRFAFESQLGTIFVRRRTEGGLGVHLPTGEFYNFDASVLLGAMPKDDVREISFVGLHQPMSEAFASRLRSSCERFTRVEKLDVFTDPKTPFPVAFAPRA